ncbi:MAG: hypothetical protein WBU92_09090 [Candidatus Dormiibacterota bacterium]
MSLSSHLPAPTSGPSVASYLALAVVVALILLVVLFSLSPGLGLHLGPLRQTVGLRPG